MSWLWLSLSCFAASACVHWLIRPFWLALPLACLAGPLLFLTVGWLVTGKSDALDGLVLFFGQVVALPAAVIVGAGFRSYRSSAAV